MTELVILSAVEQLERLLDEKAAALQGAEEQAEGLKGDLTLMLDFLKESARSRNLKHLTSQVREMAHDAKAIIDACTITESGELESVHLRLRQEIGSIRSRFREASDRKIQSGVEEAEDVVRQHQVTMAPSEGDDVVGLEESIESLIHMVLFDREKYLQTTLIKGMGGMGKTTLAREAYNHAAVVDRFEHRAWACASGEFSPEEVLRVLIAQLVELGEDELKMLKGNMDIESLQQMLCQHLQGTTYLIVLDDLWDSTYMNPVITALPCEDKSSRLLLTSRSSQKVEDNFFINMRPLTHEQSWQLLSKIVFTSDQRCPKHLEKLGRKIVRKCNDLPLAIKEVGRQLVKKRQTTSEWEEFLESMDFSETIASLESSYHRLPPKLKSSFVYMSFFKEGTTIRAEKFVHIWTAAEMVIQGEQDYETMEEIARRCLDELIEDSLIAAVADARDDRTKTFCINGFLHKISISKAEEEINFEILRHDGHYQSPCRPRHRVIYCSRDKFNYSTNQDKHLVSLLFRGGGNNIDASPSYWKSHELLKILDFEGFGLKTLPETACELSRLRCLGLRNNYIQELPHTLGHLKNLEVLDIAQNFMVEVPDVIREMDTLRHLYMSEVICRTPLKIDALKNLQTLTYISVDNWEYELSSLKTMTNLGKLGIEELDGNSDVNKLFTSLAELENLNCLTLRGFRFRSMPLLDNLGVLTGLIELKLYGRLTRLPSVENFPPNIRYLTLVNSCLDEDPMPELEKLTALEFLKLRNAYNGQEMVISDDGFRELSVMCIEELWHLRNIRIRKGGGSYYLHRLEIYNCPYLDNLPEAMIAYVWKVKHLYMVTTKNIAKKIRGLSFRFETYTNIKP